MTILQCSSPVVELDRNKKAVLLLKLSQNSKPQSVLFKVKTNLKDHVILRHNYGLLFTKNQQTSQKILHIQFAGPVQEIAKAKLQILYIQTSENLESYEKKSIKQIRELYNKQQLKANQEGSLLLPFSLNQDRQEQQQEFRLKVTMTQNKQAKSKFQEEQKEPEMRFSSDLLAKQSQEQVLISQIKPAQLCQSQNKLKIHYKTGFQLAQLFRYILLAFMFGMLLGIKLQRSHIDNLTSGQANM